MAATEIDGVLYIPVEEVIGDQGISVNISSVPKQNEVDSKKELQKSKLPSFKKLKDDAAKNYSHSVLIDEVKPQKKGNLPINQTKKDQPENKNGFLRNKHY